MSISDREITQAVQNNQIIINPFKATNLNASSYDVTLGLYFYRMNPPPVQPQQLRNGFYNPYNRKHVEQRWNGFHKGGPIKQFENFGMTYEQGDNINPEKDVGILLRPRETILAHTQEFIGCLAPYSALLTGHKDLAFNFINVSAGGKWGDTNYVDRWTLHITNMTDYYVPLICGKKIATIAFFGNNTDQSMLSSVDVDFDLEEVVKAWRPSNLLPTTYMLQRPPSRRRSKTETIGGLEVPTGSGGSGGGGGGGGEGEGEQNEAAFRRQNMEYQQQINQEQQRHRQRIQKMQTQQGGRRTLKLPEPPRDGEGNPIVPPALQSIETKQTKGPYIAPTVLSYDPYRV